MSSETKLDIGAIRKLCKLAKLEHRLKQVHASDCGGGPMGMDCTCEPKLCGCSLCVTAAQVLHNVDQFGKTLINNMGNPTSNSSVGFKNTEED